ncbi:MAG TPA: hypothetical protein VM370_04610 [Candidatus Thermoplasmatota archaeon]|nr:hypothetical protein [Candidatus Thermoplasmatota archaeon]
MPSATHAIRVDLDLRGPSHPASSASSPSQQGATTSAAAVKTADLRLTKNDTVDPVVVGSQFSYVITITNLGPDKANDLIVTDALPAGVSFVSASDCTHASGTVTCAIKGLNKDAVATRTIVVQATAAGNKSNTANVTATEFDPNTANNRDTELTSVVTAAPTGLTCTEAADGVHLSWSDVTGATSYNVYRAAGVEGSFVLLANTPTNAYLDSTAAVGQAYRYHVTAVSGGGESAASGDCFVASVPVFPSLFAVSAALVGSGVAIGLVRRARR